MAHSVSIYKEVAVVFNPDKDRARTEYKRLITWLAHRHLKIRGGTRVTAAMKSCDLVVVLGGDGTVLQVAREVAAWEIPVLGVNVGRLGFLAATEVGAMYRTLTRVLSGHGRVEKRTMVSATVTIRGKIEGPLVALNDCVIRTAATGHIMVVQASIGDRLLASYRGDGLIAATPTGSTAYNLAASGPIVHPELDVLLLSPICPHSLMQRPLVIPSTEVVSVEIGTPNPPALLCIDGKVTHVLHSGDSVEFSRAPTVARLLLDPGHTFYQVLQNKLKWGGV